MQSPSLRSMGRWVGTLARRSRASKPAPPSDLDLHPQSPARSSWAPWGWHQLLAPCHPVSKAPKGRCPERAWRPGRAWSFTDPLEANGPFEALAPPRPPCSSEGPQEAQRRPPILASPRAKCSPGRAPTRPVPRAHTRDPQQAEGTPGLNWAPGLRPQRTGVGAGALTEGPCGLTGLLTGREEAAHQILTHQDRLETPQGPQTARGQGPQGAPTGMPTAAEKVLPWLLCALDPSPHLSGPSESPAQSGSNRPVER